MAERECLLRRLREMRGAYAALAAAALPTGRLRQLVEFIEAHEGR